MARKQATSRRRSAAAADNTRAFVALRRSATGAIRALAGKGAELRLRGHRAAQATVRAAREAIASRAVEARDQTVQAATRLERAFEQRVSRAISRLGVPNARDVRALSRQVEQLQRSVERLRRARA